jgi:integrase
MAKALADRRRTGIEPRHVRSCAAKGWDEAGVCSCSPTFQAAVFDKRSGKTIRKTFPTLSAAESWRSDARVSVRKGKLTAPTRQTIGEALHLMLDGMKNGSVRNRNRKVFKPSSIRSYETVIDSRLRERFGAHKLTDLHRNDVQDFAEHLVAEGLDPSTVRNVLMPLRVVYRIAVRRGDVAFSPTHDLELPAVEGKRERVADPAEAQALLDALPVRDRALWATAFYAGLRNGELRALRVEDIDLGAATLRVERSWDNVEGPVAPKSTAGTRVIPICAHLRAYLEPHLHGSTGLVFGRTPTRAYHYKNTVNRAYKAWVSTVIGDFFRGRSAGIERVTLHEARHSFRTYLDYAGVSEARCDRYMGHSDGRVGRRYTHALMSHLSDDAAALDAYLDGVIGEKVVPFALTGIEGHEGLILSAV